MLEILIHDIMFYGYEEVQIIDFFPIFNLAEIKFVSNGEKEIVDIYGLTKKISREKSMSVKIL